MTATVVVVDINSLTKAFDLIKGINDLNSPQKRVVIKVGIYTPQTHICTTINTLNSIIESFDKATEICIVESDNFEGEGLKRLEIWKDCYNERAYPFNLSDDKDIEPVEIAGERLPLSHILVEPNVFISTHLPRRYKDSGVNDLMNLGSIIKNLLGLIPDKMKHRFHEHLPTTLLDIYEVIGGIDLAVLDGTHVFMGCEKKNSTVSPGVLIVGQDAFAVEAIGAYLVGFNPTEMPVLQEAKDRGLGQTDIKKIDIVGDIETPRKLILESFEELSLEKL